MGRSPILRRLRRLRGGFAVSLPLWASLALAGCAHSGRPATAGLRTPPPVASASAAAGQTPSRYLYIWAGDEDGKDSDFMAVVDVLPGSPRYGQVISSTPVGAKGSMPHHLEYQLPGPGRWLFGNGHHTEQIFLFDLSDPESPRVHGILGPVPPYRYPHDFARLPNGHVLVGFLRSDGPSPRPDDTQVPGGHGGIAELDADGRVLRTRSAADPSITDPIRPYAFALLPEIDRMVTTSALMHESFSADVVQIWRLSDLALLKTLPVPPARLPNGELMQTFNHHGELAATGNRMPFEPRVMTDGSVLFNAYGCGIYRLTDLAGTPALANVFTIPVPQDAMNGGCSIPVVVGRYWLMPVANVHEVVVLDIGDPAHPTQVTTLATPADFYPHWLAKDPGADRLILGEEMGHEHRMMMLRLDPATGHLSWDESLRSPDGSLGISFERQSWPHGDTGPALAHAALFRP